METANSVWQGLSFSKSVQRTFHDVPYVLTVAGDNEGLSIEVEHAEDGRRWRSKFASRFIEEITQRTGNAKKFDVFVRMMLSALAQESDAVYLDVLTARDLEMLRRHANPQGPPTTSTAAGLSDKRYMILTYRAEFDKVHYPLPLPLDERSPEEALRAMVGRLRAELAEARQANAELERACKGADNPGHGGDDSRAAALRKENAELGDGLRAARREIEHLRAEMRSGGDSEFHKLKDKLKAFQAELQASKNETREQVLKNKREAEINSRELRGEKQKVEKLHKQVRALEEEKRRIGRSSSVNDRSRAAQAMYGAPRSREPSRTPSADRSRPTSAASRPWSRPPSRPVSAAPSHGSRGAASRASSVASSRERSPSPSSFTGSGGRRQRDRPWATQRNDSPGVRERKAPSPSSTLSPYRNPVPNSRVARTPSPGQARAGARERTPSPGTLQRRGVPVGGPASGGARPPVSLRDKGVYGYPPSAASGSRGAKPGPPARYGNVGAGGQRPSSAGRPGSATDREPHQPGSLFGLAANLGLGPMPREGAAPPAGPPMASGVAIDSADACDIDARLQALQSFLKQTKGIAGA